MSATSTTLFALSGGVFTGSVVMQAISDPAWEKIASGGAALLVAGILVFVLKYVDKSHAQCSSTVASVATEFSKTSKEMSERFSDTAASLHREMRESNERREDTLHQLLREARK